MSIDTTYTPELSSETATAEEQTEPLSWPKTAKELGFGYSSKEAGLDERRVTLANWAEGEEVRWSFMHACELVPSAEVHRGYGNPGSLKRAEADLGSLAFKSLSGVELSIDAMLAQTYTDGFLVLHQGKVITEQYCNDLQPHTKHLMQSVTKSFVGTLAEILVEQRVLNPDTLVEHYLPELGQSGYGDATVRQVMDMTTSILYKEDYGVVSDLTRHEASAGWRSRTDQLSTVPESQELFLKELQKDPNYKHGERFSYVSCNTDVLGWVIERVTERPLAELLSEAIWSKLGAEENARLLVDPWGLPASSGGLNVTLRDLARFGQLLCQGGSYNGQQVFSSHLVESIRNDGSNELWRMGDGSGLAYLMPGGAYRSQWWVTDFASKAFYAAGIHGQHLFIAPEAQVVIAKVSSQPQAITPDFTSNTLLAFEMLVHHLDGHGSSKSFFK